MKTLLKIAPYLRLRLRSFMECRAWAHDQRYSWNVKMLNKHTLMEKRFLATVSVASCDKH
uniref:Uncharacterized protein n=1 Tax=Strigamia maritima TaxID=126957 RepID=T1JBI2_STRMM